MILHFKTVIFVLNHHKTKKSMEKLMLNWKTQPMFKKRVLRHLIMWLVIYIIYNIDLITAWAGQGVALSGLTVIACSVSVYLTLPYVKKNIFDRLEDHDFSLNNQILLRFIGKLFLYALLGSIVSFIFSLAHCLPFGDWNWNWNWNWNWDTFFKNLKIDSSLYHTSYNSLADSVNKALSDTTALNWVTKNALSILGTTENTAFFFSFIRNFPEAVTTTAVFTLWDAMIAIEKQGKKIEKLQLLKEMLGQQDWIHALMNTFFDQTAHLEKIAKTLQPEDKKRLDAIIELQKAVGKLQRYRHSLIKDNDELVALKYEIQAMTWMQEIVKEHNPKIIFAEDIETISENIQIVPGTLMELIWNSYKYSKFTDKMQISNITVELAIKENQIWFFIKNPIGDKNTKANTTQSGIKTLRKRLDLEYGKNYSFKSEIVKNLDENLHYYEVQLKLPIK